MSENGNVFSSAIRSLGELPFLLSLFAIFTIVGHFEIPCCLFRHLLGRPCPTCGTTSAVTQIVTGNFSQAWALNPIGFVVVAAFAKRGVELAGPPRLSRLLIFKVIDVVLLITFLVCGIANYLGYV